VTSQAHCNYDHQLSTVNNDGPIVAKWWYSPWFLMALYGSFQVLKLKFIDIDDYSKKYANLLAFIR
jgi:hypothetical protein